MPRCPHRNVQEMTNLCLDCGRNIYETDQEYLADLRRQKQQRDQGGDPATRAEIERLERSLGIKHPGNANCAYTEGEPY